MRLRLALLACAAPAPLWAADLDVTSRVERVTIYPDAAVVTRVASFDLPAGASGVTLHGLPARLEPASIQVSAQASGALSIGAVDVHLSPGEPKAAPDPALRAKIDALTEERDRVAARIEALTGKKSAIETYGNAGPGSLGVEGKPFDVSQWQGAWDAVGNGLAAVGEEIRQAKRQQEDLEAQISAAEAAVGKPAPAGSPLRDVTIALSAEAPVKGELVVSYRVAAASWRPVYEARLLTAGPKPSLALVRRAEISQRTGEDWRDAELSVSTVRASGNTGAPELSPLQVAFAELVKPPPSPAAAYAPAPAKMAAREQAAREQAAREQGSLARSLNFSAPVQHEAVVEQAALEASSFQATYRIAGKLSVNQDGLTKTFTLASRTLAPDLSVTATPEIEPTAFLKARFTQEEEAPLLPGEVSLTRDGVYVGRARFRQTPQGEPVELGFGADDRVKITRVPLRRRENEPGWFDQSRNDLREFKTTVRNLHAEPIRITVLDRVPFSENAAITVETTRETTPPTLNQPDDRRGVVGWSYEYKAGEQKEILLGYRIKWPSERDVVFTPRPLPAGRF